jgi:hypothetical protein
LLRRLRLAAQRLTPRTAAASPEEAGAAVCGVQAQDVRAAALALRSRVPGLTRTQVHSAPLVRTWTVRGTVHLIPAADRGWLHAVLAPRLLPRFERLIEQRGALERARGLLPDLVDLLEDRPRTRAELLSELAQRGHGPLRGGWVNVLVPWVAQQGLVLGLADGRLRAAEAPPPVDPDEALATMARRYLAGYGPAGDADLARWAGIPLGLARRGLTAIGPVDRAGDLLALPGTLDSDPPPAPPALLLPAFDTLMLGYRSRAPVVAAEHDRRILPGGGILRPVVVARGRAAGTWRLARGGRVSALEIQWFGEAPAVRRALAAEAGDLGRFLGLRVELSMAG